MWWKVVDISEESVEANANVVQICLEAIEQTCGQPQPLPCEDIQKSRKSSSSPGYYRAAGVALRPGKNTEPTGSIRDVHFELTALWIQPSTFSRVIDIWREYC